MINNEHIAALMKLIMLHNGYSGVSGGQQWLSLFINRQIMVNKLVMAIMADEQQWVRTMIGYATVVDNHESY